jgi:hypothetical protein
MDEYRAFKKPEPPQSEVLIDARAMDRIKDIARRMFREHNIPLTQHQLMFLALFEYMVIKGAHPNFKVEIK